MKLIEKIVYQFGKSVIQDALMKAFEIEYDSELIVSFDIRNEVEGIVAVLVIDYYGIEEITYYIDEADIQKALTKVYGITFYLKAG